MSKKQAFVEDKPDEVPAWIVSFSVIHFLGSLGKLVVAALRVTGSCIQILVAQKLSQADKIVSVVCQKLVGHRMPEQMWMQLDADQGTVFVTQ